MSQILQERANEQDTDEAQTEANFQTKVRNDRVIVLDLDRL